jgi:hypothetical protein
MRQGSALRTLAVASCALALVVTGTLAALVILSRVGTSYEPSDSVTASLFDAATALAYALVGVIVTLKRPANLVGWALVLAGVGLLLGGVFGAYGELALLGRPEAGLPAGTAVGALSAGSWTPLMAGVFLLLATFPSGSISSRRTRHWVVSVLSGFAIVWVLISLSPGSLDPPLQAYDNPLAVTESKVLVICMIPIIAGCLVSVALAGVNVVRRFRRSRGLERQQFKWLAWSGGLLAVTLPFAAAFNYSRAAGIVFSAELMALPVSVGIAVLRYRLYDIDRVISRTLVYGSLTVILGATYGASVLAGQALFASFAGGSNLAIAVSTLVVAALFLPLRSRVQALVDRRFYRRRYDAQQTLQAFGARLREEVDLETLSGDLRGVVTETMQPSHVSLWLRQPEVR